MTSSIDFQSTADMNERIEFAKMRLRGFSTDELLLQVFVQKREEQEKGEAEVKQTLTDRLHAIEDLESTLSKQALKIDFLAAAKNQIGSLEQNMSTLRKTSLELMKVLEGTQIKLQEQKAHQTELVINLQKLYLTLNQKKSTPSFENELFEFGQELCHSLAHSDQQSGIIYDDSRNVNF